MISETKPEQPTSPDDRVTGELNISREEAHQYRTTPWAALWSFYRGDRGRVGLSLLLFTLKHAPVWVWPLFAKQMTRGVEIGGEQGYYMLWTGALVLGLVVAQNVPSHMAFMHLFSRAKRNMEARLRSEIVRRLQQLSIAYHGQTESGRLQAKVLRDVEAVERLSHTLINSLFPGVLGLVFALVVSLVKDPIMAIFFLVAIPIAALLRKVFHLRIRERNREFRTNIEFMSGKVSEMIDMIPITRAHAVEKHEIRRMDDELERVRHRGIRLDMMNAMFRCANWVSFQLIRLSCLAVTSYLALTTTDDTFGLSDVIMYQGLFEVILRSVGQVLNTYPMIAKGFESIHSISEVLDCPDIEHNRGKRKVDDVRGQLDFEHVTFAYPTGDKAIEGFNLHISPGESIAVVGESGAGKSTLMNLIIGFHRPTGGRILLDGEDMEDLDLRTYRRHLAVVPQHTVLFSGSVRENIAYGLTDVDDKRIWEILELANAAEFVAKLPEKLDTTIGEGGGRLSGGQKQRISIARAMIRNPRVIIFDEATSALDVMSERLVQEAIDRLIDNRTTFIVAHRLSTIRRCNRIVVMKDGRIIECGSDAELMQQEGEFHRLKSLQV